MGAHLDIVKDSLIAELRALDGLSGDALKQEISRAQTKVKLAGQVNAYVSNQIEIAKLATRTKGMATEAVERAVDSLVALPKGES